MKIKQLAVVIPLLLAAFYASAKDNHSTQQSQVADQVLTQQRGMLAKNTENQGFGPQSPRDITSKAGDNPVIFSPAPAFEKMNLCNIHFHKNAEHKGGEFTKYAGNGDGHGGQSGYIYSGKLTEAELTPVASAICPGEHGQLQPGDTIELHYVHSSAQVSPGPTLAACLHDSIKNPQLRVEAQVYVLVNDNNALNFIELTKPGIKNGWHQALNIPANTGKAIQYAGSTTGPAYNETGSPFQVTWSVRPKVAKVNIETVGAWCKDNVFNENHAHGVRNLVINTRLLSKMQ
ncbi:delta-class carbonic anhydrase [Rheinheimera muenzenbergensis]|uniref:Delta-class carbonic anhydrase n=1 Tax=Rheinheimera muenzenbergensis TaxID=1193628 RepID=A0ABU8C8T4_9GAMM